MIERWQFFVDQGGTFTDCIGVGPDGDARIVKVLSCDEAPLVGIRALLQLGPDDPIPPSRIRLGTTLATNALLERTGARCALLVTRGFADLLVIGDQTRPEIFALDIERPAPLPERAVEVDARLDRNGARLTSPDPAALRPVLEGLRADGITSLAILVLHAYVDGAIETELAALARAVGFEDVTTSHDASAQIGLLARGDTTVADAYLTPLLRRYLSGLHASLPGCSLEVMQSSGGLVDARRFRGRDAVLSGPAGGAVAVGHIATALGRSPAIGFDMGGTSTDVTRFDGELQRTYETAVAGVRLRTPMMAVHTVAAGGGSLCRFDGHRYTVGPGSAGADPGPLCYGSPDARELALTDVDLVLGRLQPDRFPLRLDPERAHRALAEVAAAQDPPASVDAVAEAFFAVATDNMAQAIRRITITRGFDARTHTLVVFGGAGGSHACAVARALRITTVVVDPWAGVLSAYGIGLADLHWHDEADAGRIDLATVDPNVMQAALAAMDAPGRAAMAGDGVADDRIDVHHRIDLRYRGTETSLSVAVGPNATLDGLRAAFEDAHAREFGYRRPGHAVEVVARRVEVVGRRDAVVRPGVDAGDTPSPRRIARLVSGGATLDAPVFFREDLRAGATLSGPALVLDRAGTVVVDSGWSLVVDATGTLVMTDDCGRRPDRLGLARDPLGLELMSNRFMSIAAQMGTVLQRTALSTNIRERLDFSCAVFDAEGGLVANAPHLPVHLGAMGESVAAVAAAHKSPVTGDVFATNDPSGGGSHLPDITVVTPVLRDADVAYWVASRGHHADVGGTAPGSMPPDATRLDEEGVVFAGQRIVAAGALDEAGVLATLRGGPHPARDPAQNLADLQAQIAANRTGARLLCELADEVGPEVVDAYMQHVQDHAAACVDRVIATLPTTRGPRRFVDHNDDGAAIAVTITREGDRLCFDFSDTADAGPHNLNAPRAVTVAAVLYVLRTLVDEPIPLNRGCLRRVDIVIRPGSLLDPPPGSAVAGGNVETSQRVVDVLLAALQAKAASQGTMNNLTFGDATFGYYETIAGGDGATSRGDGTSGVHTHMTNTRITDPEVLESRFPVRLVRFALRPDSGGAGRHRGGDGLVRELEFLAPLQVAVLADRRVRPPFGLAGGESGAAGRTTAILPGGPRDLPGRAQLRVAPGDRIRIETPGGGGFGPARGE